MCIRDSSYLEQCLFPQNDVLHCAVSGGADSSALLILASMTGKEVIAHHVDHGLRLSGDAERDLVRGLANKVGARFEAKVSPRSNSRWRASARCKA